MSRGRPGTTPGHGTYARAVTKRCGCPACNAAAARYQNERALDAAAGRLRRTEATGTRRRIRALEALGWPADLIGARMGVTGNRVRQLAHAQGLVHIATHRAVLGVYDVLSMTPGPSDITRHRAVERGWVPPLAWDDETIDDPGAKPTCATRETGVDEVSIARAIAGTPTTLTRAERTEVVRTLAARGLSDAQIAARCLVHVRTVERDRKTHAIPSTWKDHAA